MEYGDKSKRKEVTKKTIRRQEDDIIIGAEERVLGNLGGFNLAWYMK
jgi:hypothetical protein